jgi:hypothetical protein
MPIDNLERLNKFPIPFEKVVPNAILSYNESYCFVLAKKFQLEKYDFNTCKGFL